MKINACYRLCTHCIFIYMIMNNDDFMNYYRKKNLSEILYSSAISLSNLPPKT